MRAVKMVLVVVVRLAVMKGRWVEEMPQGRQWERQRRDLRRRQLTRRRRRRRGWTPSRSCSARRTRSGYAPMARLLR